VSDTAFLLDAEILKCVLNQMIEEAGVKLYCHSWGSQAVMDGDTVQGVIVESKSGGQAILGKLTIDCTGMVTSLPLPGLSLMVRWIPT